MIDTPAAARLKQFEDVLAAFLLSLVWLAIRLIGSFAEINRVNSALLSANDALEQRVEERTRELKDAQSELLDAARQAGMAEIATNVLHNVGNVLNSVNISADLVTRKLGLEGGEALVTLFEGNFEYFEVFAFDHFIDVGTFYFAGKLHAIFVITYSNDVLVI